MTAPEDIDIEIEEASAMGETIFEVPPEPPKRQTILITTCDALWLPPCPVCSWIALWRSRSQDHFEIPDLSLARNTSSHYGKNYYMLRGCKHATDLGCRVGPIMNRLWLAVAWRKHASELLRPMFGAGYSDETRAEFHARLGHPSTYPSSL